VNSPMPRIAAGSVEPSANLALVAHAPGEVGLEPRDTQEAHGLLVRVTPHHVGLCGTDLEIIDGTLDPAYVRYPVVLGHEWSGVVASVGEDVTSVKPGDRVVVEGIIPCSVCAECRRGNTNLCSTYEELGFTRDGAAGPAVTVLEHLVHRLDDSVRLDAAALAEPAAVALRGLNEIDLQPGARILVVGDGTIGLLVTHLARLWSPASVSVVGQRAVQAELAQKMGADEFLVDPPPARSFDVAIEAAGNIHAVETALAAVARGGQVLLLGISGHGKTVPLSPDDVVNNDLRIRGSFGSTAASWAEIATLLNTGRFDPAPLITHRFPFAQFGAALEVLRRPTTEARGKVLLDLTEAPDE
jgi:L-iditol 2-dehydrogenase